MMDPDSFFSQLPDDIDDKYHAIREQRQFSFEENVIKRTFTECGIKISSWGRLAKQCSLESGLPKMNFNWFNSSFQFPFRLCGKRIAKIHDLSIADIFKSAGNNRLFRAVTKNILRQEIDTAQGFVFVFPVVRSYMCAHNVSSVQGLGPRWTMTGEDGILHIEPTKSFFQGLGSEWFT